MSKICLFFFDLILGFFVEWNFVVSTLRDLAKYCRVGHNDLIGVRCLTARGARFRPTFRCDTPPGATLTHFRTQFRPTP